MSGFSESWLGLREPADHRARSAALVARLLGGLSTDAGTSPRRPFEVIDLATGTGSNIRYLAPLLPDWQAWTVLDADTALLDVLPVRMAAWASRQGWSAVQTGDRMVVAAGVTQCVLRREVADLRAGLGARQGSPALVTAAALLDLVSREWLSDLVRWLVAHRAAALFALNYDGRTVLEPGHEDDEWLLGLVNRHQQTDKGFGLALGPDAPSQAASLLGEAGWEVVCKPSDWVIDSAEAGLQTELIAGWVAAAEELQPADRERLRAWESRRSEDSRSGRLRIVVGHQDVAAWPAVR